MFRVFRPVAAPATLLLLPLLAALAFAAATPAQAQTVTLILYSAHGTIFENGDPVVVSASVSPASPTPFTVEISAQARSGAGGALNGMRVSLDTTTLSFAANAPSSRESVVIWPTDNRGHTEGGAIVTFSGTVVGGTNVTGPDDLEVRIVEDDGIGTSADSTRPTLNQAGSSVNGDRIVLDFSESLNSSITPRATHFLYRAGTDTNPGTDQPVTAVSVSGSTVTLTLGEPVDRDDVVSVTYSPPTDGNLDIDLAQALQDAAGNPVYRVPYTAVTNNSPPRVNLVLAPGEIGEAGGVSTVTATLADPATAAFTVTVAVAPEAPATVDDFTESANMELRFDAGDTESTGEVTITAVDNDEEAGHVALTVSATLPSGITQFTAPRARTLTIRDDEMPDRRDEQPDRDDDAAVPQAWLAHFGRVATGHVLDDVRARLKARRGPGLRARLAGRTIGAAPPSGLREPGPGAIALVRRPVPVRDLLTGSAVALTGASGGGGTLALWGSGGYTGFEGRDGALRLDGDVTTASIGADYAVRRLLLGLALSHSWGDGGYRDGSDTGTLKTSLTGAYPYVGFAAAERLSLWGVAGYGHGTLEATPPGQPAREADMSLAMAGGGARGILLLRTGSEGPELSVAGEAVFVSTNSDDTAGLKGADATTTLMRLGVEGSWAHAIAGGATLTPSLDIGVRRDGGDAETGFGVDVGGGIAWVDSRSGLSLALNARALAVHEEEDAAEWGVSGSLRYDPLPGSRRGASFVLTPSWGAGTPRPSEIAAAPSGAGSAPRGARLGAEFAYGFPALAGRFTGAPYLGIGLSRGARQVRAGWRLTPAWRGAPELSLRLEAARHDRAGAAAEYVTRLRFALRG